MAINVQNVRLSALGNEPAEWTGEDIKKNSKGNRLYHIEQRYRILYLT